MRILSEVISAATSRTVNKWFEEWSATHEKKTMRVLDREAESILYRALGFKRGSFGDRWEVDHTNGRGNPIVEYLQDKANTSVRAFLRRLDDKMDTVLPTAEMTAAAEKKFQEFYMRDIQQSLYKAAERLAQKHMDEMVERIGSGLHLEMPDVIKVEDAKERLGNG